MLTSNQRVVEVSVLLSDDPCWVGAVQLAGPVGLHHGGVPELGGHVCVVGQVLVASRRVVGQGNARQRL